MRFIWALVFGVVLGVTACMAMAIDPTYTRLDSLRIFNGLAIIVMLVWIIRRVLRYERDLLRHRKEILDGFADRKSDIDQLKATAEELSEWRHEHADKVGIIDKKVDTIIEARRHEQQIKKETGG